MDTVKECSKCGVVKLVSEFYKDKRRKDGLYSHCKLCQNALTKAYSSTEKGKEIHQANYKRWYDERGGKEWQREYAKSDERRAQMEKYRQSLEGRAARRKMYVTHKIHNPGLLKAHDAVKREIEKGSLPRASAQTCVECGEQAHDYHHFSYDKDHWLDVVPYCHDCHMKLHAEL